MFGVASPGSRHRHQWGEGGHEWSELYQAQGHHQPVSKTNLPAAASRSLVVSKFPPCSCGVFSFVSPSPLAPWGSLMTHTSSASFLHLCLLGCSPKSPPHRPRPPNQLVSLPSTRSPGLEISAHSMCLVSSLNSRAQPSTLRRRREGRKVLTWRPSLPASSGFGTLQCATCHPPYHSHPEA